jgi:transcriptional regulator of acetoin/glycerol metabolism
MIKPEHLPEEIRSNEKQMLTSESDERSNLSEADKIRNALGETAGNITRAASLLGVHRTTLWRKMREFGIPKYTSS